MMPQNKNYKKARKEIAEINENKNSYIVIWYAVADIEQARRVIAIVVQNLNGQARSFSIFDQIGLLKDKFTGTIADYDKCEKNMLGEYFQYVRGRVENTKTFWLHWRMKLAHYGFSALENRFKVLGGKPIVISENSKIDVCELFKERYGENFVNKNRRVDRSSWRVQYLAKKNSIETAGFLEYADEQEAIKEKQYDKILTSLSRKTSIVTQFLDLSYKNKLKTDAKWTEIHGYSIQGLYEMYKGKWWFNLIIFGIGIIIGLMANR